MTTDEKYMSRCIQLARNGFYGAAPNPMVGAVIVHDGKIIGEGYHVRCGGPHAEVNAVRSVRNPELLKESTLALWKDASLCRFDCGKGNSPCRSRVYGSVCQSGGSGHSEIAGGGH